MFVEAEKLSGLDGMVWLHHPPTEGMGGSLSLRCGTTNAAPVSYTYPQFPLVFISFLGSPHANPRTTQSWGRLDSFVQPNLWPNNVISTTESLLTGQPTTIFGFPTFPGSMVSCSHMENFPAFQAVWNLKKVLLKNKLMQQIEFWHDTSQIDVWWFW